MSQKFTETSLNFKYSTWQETVVLFNYKFNPECFGGEKNWKV